MNEMDEMDERRVVVGVDGSPTAQGAALWAGLVADRTRCPLWIVHACTDEFSSMAGSVVPGEHPFSTRMRRRHARDALQDALDPVRQHFPNVSVHCGTVPGPPGPVLAAAGAEAALVVVGAVGVGAAHTLSIGSTAIEVAQNTPCPVVVWRGGSPPPPNRAPVLVGVDGSDTSEQTLLTAAEFADLFGAPLLAVQSCSSAHVGEVTVPDLADWNNHEKVKRDRLNLAVDAAAVRFPALSIRTLITMNDPHRVLLERAVSAQLVVLGSPGGPWGSSGAALGPVSRHLLLHNPCPTMICHNGTG
ncbi:universal stress protein [Rhodococcus sp. NPDC056960]|uniref:universal stress protein n=1 Tax=Rhodococcus sp. NPDC056960 TaxID=3345982 RepID=UPI00363D60A9